MTTYSHFNRPIAPGTLIERRRLTDLLEQAVLTAPWTCVQAPFGSGKTMSVAQWSRTTERTVHWLALEATEYTAESFWPLVGQALQLDGIDSFEDVLQKSEDSQADVLVIDQSEHIYDEIILRQLLHVVERGHIHLIIITRHQLPQTFRRHRLTTLAARIGWHDLACTAEETRQLLQGLLGERYTEQLEKQLNTSMAGWICGLQAAAQWLKTLHQPQAAMGHVVDIVQDMIQAEIIDYLSPIEREIALKAAQNQSWSIYELSHFYPLAHIRSVTQTLTTSSIWFAFLEGEEVRYRYLPIIRAVFQRIGEQDHSVPNIESEEGVEALSGRELEVLTLISQGATNHVIAEQLVVSINTIKKHVSNILSKLQVANRTHAVMAAQAYGWL